MKTTVNLIKPVLFRWLAFILTYSLIIVVLYYSLYHLGVLKKLPMTQNLLNWDASWYYSISSEGYYFKPNEQSNAGFFPGFAYLWKVLGLSPLGISIVNLLLFLSGAFMLKEVIKSSYLKLFLIVSLPSVFFFYLPYSESLFYFFSSIFIISWYKNWKYLTFVFALALSFVRPVFFFLIPALLGIFLLKKQEGFQYVKSSLVIMIGLLIGASLGMLIIGEQVGDLFAYSKSQIIFWEHGLKWPSFPLTTWRSYRILWLDGLALLLTVCAVIILIRDFLRVHFFNWKTQLSIIEIVALGYLMMILVYIIFFHPVENGRTSILSINRYVFCNPFLHFVLLKRIGTIKLSLKHIAIPLMASILVVLAIGVPFASIVQLNYEQSLIFSGALLAFFMASSLVFYKWRYQKYYSILFLATSLIVQLYLFNSFLKGNWVG